MSAPAPLVNLDSFDAPLQPESKFLPITPPSSTAENAIDDQYALVASQKAKQKDIDESVVAKAAQAQADLQSKDSNWLLNNYEAQMHQHALDDKTKGDSLDLYDTIASNKDLAKLAGIKSSDTGDDDKSDSQKSDKEGSEAKIKSDANPKSTDADKKNQHRPGEIRPLITPLGAPDAAGLHDFYSSLPSVDAPAGSGPSQLDTLAAQTGDSAIGGLTSTVDMPGLTAAQGTAAGNEKTPASTISLDMVPGQGDRHEDSFTYSNAPATTTEALLQNQNIAQMALPVSTGHAPVVISPILTNPALDVQPMPVTAPVSYKPRVADPFDMLTK